MIQKVKDMLALFLVFTYLTDSVHKEKFPYAAILENLVVVTNSCPSNHILVVGTGVSCKLGSSLSYSPIEEGEEIHPDLILLRP